MMELKVPSAGESITEVQIGEWYHAEGDVVAADQPVVVIETEKATLEVTAPAAGKLVRILKRTGEVAKPGEVIGEVEPSDQPVSSAPPKPAREQPPSPKPAPVPPSVPTPAVPAPAAADEVVRMSPLRRALARRLVEARQAAALLTTFNEVDMSAVMTLRREWGELFQQKHGVKLGLMSFFVKAAIEALKFVPQVNSEVRGEEIVYHSYYDIGLAVSTERGLVVPVLRHAGRLSFAEIEQAIGGFAERARDGKLTPAELQGGTFTITNGGVFGSLLSTPLVNPPQSAILGMHTIQERPVARAGQVVIRPMMYVALTYDHRNIDGREAVTFLRRIKETVETPARLLIEA